MADLKAVVEHLGKRVLGETFEIDEWQPPETPASERFDAKEAIAALSKRLDALESAPTVLPHATYEAIKRAVDARLASAPAPEAVVARLDASALADTAERLEALERAIAVLKEQRPQPPVDDDIRETVMSLVESVTARDDLTETMVKSLRAMQERMQIAAAQIEGLHAEKLTMSANMDELVQALETVTVLVGKARRVA